MRNSITAQITITIAITLLVGLLGFGYTSFNAALEAGGNHEEKILTALGQELAEQIYLSGNAPLSLDEIMSQVTGMQNADYTVLLLDRSGQIAAKSSASDIDTEQAKQLPRLRFMRREPASGSLSLAGSTYAWASRPLHNTQYTLVVLFRLSKGAGLNYIQAIRTPLALAMALIIFASWAAALVLNAWFRKHQELLRELQQQKLFDPVTGIARAALLADRLQAKLLTARREGSGLAIISIGLEHMQKLRSHLGPEQGDQLLLCFRDLILESTRDSDIVGLADTQTLILVLPGTDSREVAIVARKLHHALSTPVSAGNDSFHLQCHMGAAVYPASGETPDELLENAAIALRVSRQANNEFTIYDKDLESFNPDQLRYVNNLRRAINEDQLYLLLQPKIDLRTHLVAGAEVLVRWRDEQGYEKLPDEFVPVAEQAGLITPLTQWVLENALLQYKLLARAGVAIPLAINISSYCLRDPTFETMIQNQLDKSAIPAGSLNLEITESAMMENQARAMDVLQRLSEKGVDISIDDFGTGYSSLTYLRKLPICELKIDKSFVTRMLRDHNDLSIVRSTIGLAHDLGMKVVAEGIEDAATLSELINNDCDIGQGYYFSPPVGLQELLKWLDDNDKSISPP